MKTKKLPKSSNQRSTALSASSDYVASKRAEAAGRVQQPKIDGACAKAKAAKRPPLLAVEEWTRAHHDVAAAITEANVEGMRAAAVVEDGPGGVRQAVVRPEVHCDALYAETVARGASEAPRVQQHTAGVRECAVAMVGALLGGGK